MNGNGKSIKVFKNFSPIFWLFLIIAFKTQVNGSTKNCWTNDACVIELTLHKSINETKQNVPYLIIDCDLVENGTVAQQQQQHQTPEYFLKRFENAFRIVLNGCRKGLKWPTFGFEYLPNCDKIIEINITNFHADEIYEFHCPSATFIQLETLRFTLNEIATVTTEALSNLALLKEIYFNTNTLRHIQRGAFDNLLTIESIQITNEPLLAIKDASLFERTTVANLWLEKLKHVTSALFQKLPQTLRALHVEKTAISVGDNIPVNASVYINNGQVLVNVTIIDCELKEFHLNDDYTSVKFLNLSGNLIEDFELTINGTKVGNLALEILDLSNNKLNYLPISWLHSLNQLSELYLHGNAFKSLPLMPILSSLPKIKNIDLRRNQLEYFTDIMPTNLMDDTLYRVLVHIDHNAWNCKWLLGFARSHPEIFRIFHYEKFLSQINVNGLECVPKEPEEPKGALNGTASLILEHQNSTLIHLSDADEQNESLNVSKFQIIFGSPYEKKRNQRGGAVIIVCMLPVGIAALFVLLYLWIYCQKVFHLSFYKSCHLCKKRKRKNTIFEGNRFDVIRQVPPIMTNTTSTTISTNYNEGYELPLNGIAPVCNCAHSTSDSTTNLSNGKCGRTHHITYVALPEEKPQKIYEEIIGGESEDEAVEVRNAEAKEKHEHMNTIYDHLAFE